MSLNTPILVKPQFSVLTMDQIEQVHDYSLKILATAGVKIDSPRALQIFSRSSGATVGEGHRVFLGRELVEWAIRAAPTAVDVFNRRGDFAFRLGEDQARFGVGVTNLFFQDPANDELSTFTRQHMALSVRLGDALPQYDVISTIGIIQDYPPEKADLYAVLEMAANTTKPLVILISNERLFTHALNLLGTLCGDLITKPFVIPYFNPVTPLVLNEATTEKMLETIHRGLPLIFSNYGMAGMSTPITAAGTLALLNAELLAGLVFSQLAREGTPVILGSLPAFFEMKTMEGFFDPHSILVNLACAEMMAHYHIPHAGTSGSGAGWGPDLLASGMFWMNHLTSAMGKVGLVPFVGSTFSSKAFSPAVTVYVHDIIGMARRFAAGFPLDEAWVGLEEIATTGPGGNFLTADLTLKHYRDAYYTSTTIPRLTLERWEQLKHPKMDRYVREFAQRLMTEHRPPDDHDELIDRGEEFIRMQRVNSGGSRRRHSKTRGA
jgi:trimethylamine--corrinoid protein Co-methyltransferase